jgi:integral membrane sensor domain MASE1
LAGVLSFGVASLIRLMKKETEMKSRKKERIAILVALVVLFSAMLAPLATAVISIFALAALGIYEFMSKEV